MGRIVAQARQGVPDIRRVAALQEHIVAIAEKGACALVTMRERTGRPQGSAFLVAEEVRTGRVAEENGDFMG